MNSDLVIFIDGYLSSKERAQMCSELIDQLKTNLNYKIALINKYPFSWGLDHKVDYYFHYGDGFMVGPPPKDILDKQLYERPYVYIDTSMGILENWLPLTNISDHVANMYNSFILTAEVAKNLGFKRVFKVEADTKFDEVDLLDINLDLEKFQDYLLYGERQEGDWAKPHHRIMDVHISGYSVDLFTGFDLVRNDTEFWELCKKINYYGKWIEYIIPTLIYYQNQHHTLKGINYPGRVREKYSNTQFDLINSPGGWTEKWKNIPKICKINEDGDTDKIGLFYWNDNDTPLESSCTIKTLSGEIIYSQTRNTSPRCWGYDEVNLDSELTITNINTQDSITETYTTIVSPDNVLDLNTRLIKK